MTKRKENSYTCLNNIIGIEEARSKGFKMPKKVYKVVRSKSARTDTKGGERNLKEDEYQCEYALQILNLHQWHDPEPEDGGSLNLDSLTTYTAYRKSHVGLFSAFVNLEDAIKYSVVMPILVCQYRGLKKVGWQNNCQAVLVEKIKPIEEYTP